MSAHMTDVAPDTDSNAKAYSVSELAFALKRMKELGLVDKIIREPTGGAHRNPRSMAIRLKAVLLNELDALQALSIDDLLQQRYARLRKYGTWQEG